MSNFIRPVRAYIQDHATQEYTRLSGKHLPRWCFSYSAHCTKEINIGLKAEVEQQIPRIERMIQQAVAQTRAYNDKTWPVLKEQFMELGLAAIRKQGGLWVVYRQNLRLQGYPSYNAFSLGSNWTSTPEYPSTWTPAHRGGFEEPTDEVNPELGWAYEHYSRRSMALWTRVGALERLMTHLLIEHVRASYGPSPYTFGIQEEITCWVNGRAYILFVTNAGSEYCLDISLKADSYRGWKELTIN